MRRIFKGVCLCCTAALALPLTYVAADNLAGIFRSSREQTGVVFYDGQPSRAPKLLFVYLPGLGNSGPITIEPYLDMLRRFGDVVVQDHDLWQYDQNKISNDVIGVLKAVHQRRVVFIGQSLGSMTAFRIMRDYRDAGMPAGPIAGFISIGGPDDASDVKWPFPSAIAHAVRGGPLTDWLGRAILSGADNDPVQAALPHGEDEDRYRRHREYIRNFPLQGFMAQIRAIRSVRGAQPGEFPKVPALIMHTREDDVLVHWQTAVPKLEQAFPNHETVKTSGIHANLIEYDTEHREIMRRWLTRLVGATRL